MSFSSARAEGATATVPKISQLDLRAISRQGKKVGKKRKKGKKTNRRNGRKTPPK